MSKTTKILEHLKSHKTITSWEAINLYRATRLSAIIFNLKKRYNIQTVMQMDVTENGRLYHYAEYVYLGEL